MTYLLSASLAMAIFYALYGLLFRRLPFHALNRAYLLVALGASLIIPLLELPAPAAALTQPVQTVFYVEDPEPFPETTFLAPAEPAPLDWWAVAWYAYLAGVGAMVLRLGRSLWRLRRLLAHPGERIGGLTIIPTSGQNASFFHWILLNDTDLTEAERRQVLAHEAEHTRLGHSADRLLVEVLRVVFWFNPVLWLVQRSLAQLHELEVDARMTRRFEAQGYARLLLKLHGGLALPLTNLFSQQPLKDRIRALFQPKPTSAMKKLLYLSALPLLAAVTLSLAQQAPPPPPPPPPIAPPPPPPPPAPPKFSESVGEVIFSDVRQQAIYLYLNSEKFEPYFVTANKELFEKIGFKAEVLGKAVPAKTKFETVGFQLIRKSDGKTARAFFSEKELKKTRRHVTLYANGKTGKFYVRSGPEPKHNRVAPKLLKGERQGAITPLDGRKPYGTQENPLLIREESGVRLVKTKAGALLSFDVETKQISQETVHRFKAEMLELGYEINLLGLYFDAHDRKKSVSASMKNLKTGQVVKKTVDLTAQGKGKDGAPTWEISGISFTVDDQGNPFITPRIVKLQPWRNAAQSIPSVIPSLPPTEAPGTIAITGTHVHLYLNPNRYDPDLLETAKRVFAANGAELRVTTERVDGLGKLQALDVVLTRKGSTIVIHFDESDAKKEVRPWMSLHLNHIEGGMWAEELPVGPPNSASKRVEASFLPNFWPFKKQDGC